VNDSLFRWLFGTTDTPYSIFLRISVGLIFSTQGFLKYIDPNLGVDRLTKIGFPYPDFTAHFVGAFEMVCGLLVLVGLWTRAAAIPLLIINLTAITSTKIPELWTTGQGFWYMVTDIRIDFAMLLSLLYLFAAGSGRYTLQEVLARARGRR
jgi:putative oxidoreductase